MQSLHFKELKCQIYQIMKVDNEYFLATSIGVLKMQINDQIKILDQSFLKGKKCKLMIRVKEKNLALQTEEGLEIIEMTSGVR